MHLCFGSFSMVMRRNGKNNAVTKAFVGRELLGFLDSGYTNNMYDSYIYLFMEQKREVPKALKFKVTSISELAAQFSRFIDKYMSLEHDLLRDLTTLVQGDTVLPDHVKDHLLRLAKELELPRFLAELFVFAVDSTSNKASGAKTKASQKRFNLLKEANEATDNKVLCKLAKLAVKKQDMMVFNICLGKLTANVYAAEALMSLFPDKSFDNRTEYKNQFHYYVNSIKKKDTDYSHYLNDVWNQDVTIHFKK